MLSYITFKRTTNVALQLALFIVLNAIIIQEFMHIYNYERNRDTTEDQLDISKNRYWRLAAVIALELFVIATIYYLSGILLDSLKAAF
jgi:hypothetical protein